MNPNMEDFLKGCSAMREAIEKSDFPKLTEAKLALSKVELGEFVLSEDFYPSDQTSTDILSYPQVIFTPEFAVKLAQEGVITLRDITDAHLMRGTNEINLWHASILPGNSATFTSKGADDCEMLLFAMSGSGLDLKITDHNAAEVPVEQVTPDSWFAKWAMPEEAADYQFTITNTSDSPQTFVIAVN